MHHSGPYYIVSVLNAFDGDDLTCCPFVFFQEYEEKASAPDTNSAANVDVVRRFHLTHNVATFDQARSSCL